MKRFLRLTVLLALGLSLSNCSKCGEIFGYKLPGVPASCGQNVTPSQ